MYIMYIMLPDWMAGRCCYVFPFPTSSALPVCCRHYSPTVRIFYYHQLLHICPNLALNDIMNLWESQANCAWLPGPGAIHDTPSPSGPVRPGGRLPSYLTRACHTGYRSGTATPDKLHKTPPASTTLWEFTKLSINLASEDHLHKWVSFYMSLRREQNEILILTTDLGQSVLHRWQSHHKTSNSSRQQQGTAANIGGGGRHKAPLSALAARPCSPHRTIDRNVLSVSYHRPISLCRNQQIKIRKQ